MDAHDGRVVPVKCDETEGEEVREFVDTAIEEFGNLHSLSSRVLQSLRTKTQSGEGKFHYLGGKNDLNSRRGIP